jgi:hypothetical protein
VHSPVVLSNATPYKTFVVRKTQKYVMLQRSTSSSVASITKQISFILISGFRYPSPDPAQCGKPTALGTPFTDIWFLLQDLVPSSVLPEDFLCAIKAADYSSVRICVQASFSTVLMVFFFQTKKLHLTNSH